MTIKECIDTVDNIKPNQYTTKDKVLWLSFIDEIIINDVLKTHEGYDGRYDDFAGYSEDKLSVPLIVPSPYDRLYTAYLKMKIDGENGETARYNNSAAMFNTYMMEYRKHYNKTHLPLSNGYKPMPPKKSNVGLSDAELENLKRELYHTLYNDVCEMTSSDKINDVVRSYISTNAEMFKGEDGYTPVKGVDYFDGEKGEKGDKGEDANVMTADGTVVSQNADFAEVAEWGDGNPLGEDRTGYFVCANVPLDGIVMKKAKSTDDVKGVSISAPAFAGNYSKDKVDSNGKLLPKYSYVAIIGFVPVRDYGRCTVGGRCMPDDNGCAIPSSNSMGYQVVDRVSPDKVLIIIEPNGDMVQRIKTKVNDIQSNTANTIKGTATGTAISMRDVSPIEHNVDCSVASKNMFNPYSYVDTSNQGTIEIRDDGSIFLDGAMDTENGDTYAKITYLLLLTEVCTLSFTSAIPNNDDVYIGDIIIDGESWNGVGEPHFVLSSGSHTLTLLQFEESNSATFIQLEKGTTPTPYKPYIADLSTVEVSRYEGNLIDDKKKCKAGTNIYFGVTNISKGCTTLRPGTYTLSVKVKDGTNVSLYVTDFENNNQNIQGMYASGTTRCSLTFSTQKTRKVNFKVYHSSFTSNDGSELEWAMLEVGNVATPYKPYIAPTIYKPDADGTVEGVKSISPNMTLISNNDGAVIDCNYNIDTKTYIDNKFAELQALILEG